MAASPDSHSGSSDSSAPAFSFGDLGKPRSSSRLLPPIKDVDPDASSELELGADDILESEEIGLELDVDAFEQAAAGIVGFDAIAPDGPALPAPIPVILTAPEPAPRPSFLVPPMPAPPSPKAPPPPSPKPFVAAAPVVLMPPPVIVKPPMAIAAPAPEPVVPALVVPPPVAVVAAPESEPAPLTPPMPALAQPSTLMGMPPAPITSPLPLEESVIVDDRQANDDEEGVLRTQEIRGDQVAQVAAFLEGDIPESTQILARSDMPAQYRQAVPQGVPTAAAWANGRHPQSAPMRARQASVAPIAVDLPRRAPSHVAIAADPRPVKKETSPLLIGGLCFAAAALVGVVGVGGYFASRTMSEKPSMAIAPAPRADEPSSTNTTAATTTATAAAADPAAAPADPAAGAAPVVASGSAGVDVSSLPAAPVGGVALPPAPVQHPTAAPVANAAPPPAQTSHVSSAPPPPATGRAGAPLPPPGAAAPPPPPQQTAALPPPPSKAAPVVAAPAVQATTGNVSVDPKLRAIVVDGNYRHVSDNGTVTLSCGPHRIKVGMNDAQSVNVPCGGSISL